MTIPDYQKLMLPLLRYARDGQLHSMREAIEALAIEFDLSEEERKELLPSGKQSVFDNRVNWAKTYLKKAILLEYPQRGFFRITERGLNVLVQAPQEINNSLLRQFPEFGLFQYSNKELDRSSQIENVTPQESIGDIYKKLRKELEVELLETIKSCSPAFFETLVVDLLVKMGYGGSIQDAGKAIGKSGDGGIDGIIKEDKLGLDIVYVQAKRWDNTVVGRQEIQKFVGALHGQKARKGVFITTSKFSSNAQEYVSLIESRIVLIDGEQLALYMIDNNLGVAVAETYEIKKVDLGYFTDA